MDRLIPVINKLQDVFDKAGTSSATIQLPRIAVVGSQSSGKSSVLENLVGKPFLPRGKDIVTRCPIIIMLNHRPGKDEWCEFDHKGNTRFKIEDVEMEIRRRTDEITEGSGISKETIKLSVYSPNVLTFTVIDLPGLVKVATEGQPEDIAVQINELVLEYVSQPNTIILAVSPGNVDIANSESMDLAKKVDPLQERTIAVLTKLDLAEDISDVLSGKKLPVKLGIVGVVNRSQQDIIDNAPIAVVLEKEKRVLQDKYGDLANRHGTPFLASKLNQILLQHIKKCVPNLNTRIQELKLQREQMLAALGSSTAENMDEQDKLRCLTTILNKFQTTYKAQIDGQGRVEMDPSDLTGGARIDFLFDQTLASDLARLYPLDGITDQEIMNAVRNSAGVASQLFLPQGALQHLIKREVAKMKPVALHCCNLVHKEMIKMIDKCLPEEEQFPMVNEEIARVVIDLLQTRAICAANVLGTYIDVQASSAKTYDDGYIKELGAKMGGVNMVGLGEMPSSLVVSDGAGDPLLSLSCQKPFVVTNDNGFTETQKALCQMVRDLIGSFFIIVLKQVQDHVPKSLLHSLIYFTVDNLNTELNTNLSPMVNELIKEAPDVADKRTAIKTELEGLATATKILDEVRINNTL